MTEKRFQVYKVSGNFGEWEVEDTLTDTVVMDRIMHKYLADRLCEKLNELFDENEWLKSELKEVTQKKNDLKELLVNSETVLEQKELQKIIYKMVYVAIDEKIEKAEEGFQQTQDNWYQGQIDALKELKKEL